MTLPDCARMVILSCVLVIRTSISKTCQSNNASTKLSKHSHIPSSIKTPRVVSCPISVTSRVTHAQRVLIVTQSLGGSYDCPRLRDTRICLPQSRRSYFYQLLSSVYPHDCRNNLQNTSIRTPRTASRLILVRQPTSCSIHVIRVLPHTRRVHLFPRQPTTNLLPSRGSQLISK